MNWVVGDIHGMLRPLVALLDRVRTVDPNARFYFVGDYVNRGPDSSGVIELLTTLPNARFVRGNHDDILDIILNGHGYANHPEAPGPVEAFRWFIAHGLWETLTSYNLEFYEVERIAKHPTEAAIKALVESIPESHRQFFRKLPLVIEEEEFFVAHAMWSPDEPDEGLAQRLETDARLRFQVLWGRYGRELLRTKRWRRTGYFGHTPVQTYPSDVRGDDGTPIRGPQIVLLDTAAALSPHGRLSAVCADDGRMVQVDRFGQPMGGD